MGNRASRSVVFARQVFGRCARAVRRARRRAPSLALVPLALVSACAAEVEGESTLDVRAEELAASGRAPAQPLEPPRIAPVEARFVPPLPAEVAEGAGIVENYAFALALGKALFWDEQAGSDGQACASCHFHAGADPRISGQLNPGFLDLGHPGGDTAFGSLRSDTGAVAPGALPSGAAAGPETTLAPGDFPFHRLTDELDGDSPLHSETNDAVSSAGAFDAEFLGIDAQGNEHCGDPSADLFHVTLPGGEKLAARQVEPRNTPSTINAVFNMRQFWDGRANNLFNGVGVFGLRDIEGDPNLRLIVANEAGAVDLGYLELENASLASQAVGPPLSAIEMSCKGRTFADLGRKLLRVRPLAGQRVAASDSVLGSLAHPESGLLPGYTYAELIRRAFSPRFWSAPGRYRVEGGQLVSDRRGYTQMEHNMSMFWGIAIMLYEATLISDRSELDELVAAGAMTFPGCDASDAVDPLLVRGCKIFSRFPFGPPPADGVRGAGCSACHAGADTFSEGALQAGVLYRPLLQVTDINGVVSTRDFGFSNVAIRATSFDLALGATDPYGNPLAFGRQYRQFVASGDRSQIKDPLLSRAIDDGTLVVFGAPNPDAKLESDGATKIPGLRNVALTPPYFSYGGYASLRQVMKFYNRGGNRRTITPENAELEAPGSTCTSGDNTGTGPDGDRPLPVDDPDCNTNVTGLIVPLGLSDCDANGVVTCDVESDDLSALVRFMEALTDRRVQCDQAPFDHPSLSIAHGHEQREGERPGAAADRRFVLPEVGAEGYDPSSGFCIPNGGDLFTPGMQGRVGGLRVPLAL